VRWTTSRTCSTRGRCRATPPRSYSGRPTPSDC
jgi:hypothetical protein